VTSARSDRALFLAAVAVLGLVVTPLLHAEEHFREEQEEESASAALALAFRAGSSDPLEALAAALARAAGDPALRQRLVTRGLARAATFDWRLTARATAAVYEAVGR